MNRKEFLKLIGLGALSITLKGSALLSTKAAPRKKVIIIGAGMAGVAAARTLTDANIEVLILEARDRIGGRMWSDDSLGTVLDFGAGWIEGSGGNPINKLAVQFGIKTSISDFDSLLVYNSNGNLLDQNKVNKVFFESGRILKKALRQAGFKNEDSSLQTSLDNVWKNKAFEEEVEKLIKWRISTEEINAATPFSNLSAWGETEKGYGGEYLIIPGGYAQIPTKLAENIDIKFNSPVSAIIDNGKGVTILTKDDSYNADYVISTLPLGVLKKGKLQFDPALPETYTKAIESMGMGNMNKLAIRFSEAFWPTDKHFLGYVSKNYGEFPIFVNWPFYAKGKPFLLATMGATFSEELYQMSAQEQKSAVDTILKKMYPHASPCEAVKFSGWKWDEFAGGSYSYLPPGMKETLRDDLAQTHGRIHFAGEATIRGYAGTVHGAYLSGIREAQKIMAL